MTNIANDILEEKLDTCKLFLEEKSGIVYNEISRQIAEAKPGSEVRALQDEFRLNQEYRTSKKDFDIDGIYGIKYVALSERHIQKNYKYIYALQGLAGKSVFEIGVGPGYQFYLLQQVLGCDMFGCDVLLDEQYVFDRLRTAIGIKELVEEQKIEYDSPIRIPEGSEAVVAFWTVFHKPWSIKEHKWFLDSCAEKLVGKKMVALRFNNKGYLDKPEVYDFYNERAEKPVEGDDNFCVIQL